MNLRPPGIPGITPGWDDLAPDVQCLVIAYEQTREHDETEREATFAGVKLK